MAGRILKDDVEALRRQADIVAVVGDYTTLKRAGRAFKGLCPFHTERTPSFTVTPDGNFYHCFGCGASGDLYDFIMRIEGVDFPEAVESLARRTGFSLRYEEMTARDRRVLGERSRLVAVTRAAQEHYHRLLFGDEGAPARRYLADRGFDRDDAERFGLGYAPLAWSALSDALTRDGVAADDLVTVGLAVRNDRGGLRDRFRGRLLFPVEDPSGDVIGFGGRVLPDVDYGDFDPPKYLNSPETPLYKKAGVVYGLRVARSEIVRAEQVLICEGYTDVMALHRAGVANAVATCGTAVGEDHLRIVARYARRVVLAFDGDAAGAKAAERAWEVAAGLVGADGLDLRVLVLADGQDPADLVAAVGPEGVDEALAAARPIVPFIVGHRIAGADLSSESGRARALRDALEIVGREPDPDLRREWARAEVADRLGIAYDFVVQTAERMGMRIDAHEKVAARAVPPAQTAGRAGGRGAGSAANLDRARVRRERAVLRVALQRPELLPEEWFELDADAFTHPRARAIFMAIDRSGGAGVELAGVLEAAEDDAARALIREVALEADDEMEDATTDGEDLAPVVAAERVRRLLDAVLAGREEALRSTLERLHHGTDGDEVRRLQEQLLDLQRRRRALVSVGV